jgi:hypothetical protein
MIAIRFRLVIKDAWTRGSILASVIIYGQNERGEDANIDRICLVGFSSAYNHVRSILRRDVIVGEDGVLMNKPDDQVTQEEIDWIFNDFSTEEKKPMGYKHMKPELSWTLAVILMIVTLAALYWCLSSYNWQPIKHKVWSFLEPGA